MKLDDVIRLVPFGEEIYIYVYEPDVDMNEYWSGEKQDYYDAHFSDEIRNAELISIRPNSLSGFDWLEFEIVKDSQ